MTFNASAAKQKDSASHIITVNGGSSSIKFAVYTRGVTPTRVLGGQVERIGSANTVIAARAADGSNVPNTPIAASDYRRAAEQLIEWLENRFGKSACYGVGHRVVHGGVHLVEHQLVTDDVVAELRRIQSLDLAHLPLEIALIEVFCARMPSVPQVACFDTAFHRDMPRVAKLLPIPRRYDEAGVRRFGFHGLSFSYLMGELERVAGVEAARGRVILAHLGSGASLAAVRGGKPMDTTMAFTPTAGLVMGTRPGDLDPGLLLYMMKTENLSPDAMDDFISHRCGLLGVSETSADMRDLVARRATDARAGEAVDLFCYQARKWIGAFAAALGGLDTLVFAGGIGEHSPVVRSEICAGLEFLGVRLDAVRNDADADVISGDGGSVVVRVIPTDEEIVIARFVDGVLGLDLQG